MKISNQIHQGLAILVFLVLTSGCSQTMDQEMEYDQNSWKTIISDTCVSYFDGCNNCRRNPGSDIAACTRKACVKYVKPVCMDNVRNSSD